MAAIVIHLPSLQVLRPTVDRAEQILRSSSRTLPGLVDTTALNRHDPGFNPAAFRERTNGIADRLGHTADWLAALVTTIDRTMAEALIADRTDPTPPVTPWPITAAAPDDQMVASARWLRRNLRRWSANLTVWVPGLSTAREPLNRLTTDLAILAGRGAARVFGSPTTGGGDPGGTYDLRPVGRFRPAGTDGSSKYDEGYDEKGYRARVAVADMLALTADPATIDVDEFLVIDQGDRYTLVLPGVVDLSHPSAGLDPRHRSVRDFDSSALPSLSGAGVDTNPYAAMVMTSLSRPIDGRPPLIPPGSTVAIVGHSFGADTALDLAADPRFNGDLYTVSHVVAAGYHSEPQLPHVQSGTNVLVLENDWDAVVAAAEATRLSSPDEEAAIARSGAVIDEFSGSLAGAGHHQQNYVDHLLSTERDDVSDFLASMEGAGFGADGVMVAVDVSVPRTGDR